MTAFFDEARRMQLLFFTFFGRKKKRSDRGFEHFGEVPKMAEGAPLERE
jgi:hypothetical protein